MSDRPVNYDREMENLERQQKELRDRYNTKEPLYNPNDYSHVLESRRNDSPIKGELLSHYIVRLGEIIKSHSDKNWKVHVVIGSHNKPFWTHRNPLGCFMC